MLNKALTATGISFQQMNTDIAHSYVYMYVTDRPHRRGTVVQTPWIFTENNLKYDYCLVILPVTVVALLTVNLGRPEGTECRRYCLKTCPHLNWTEAANDSGLSLPLFNVCSVFPNFVDAELHLLESFITLKENDTALPFEKICQVPINTVLFILQHDTKRIGRGVIALNLGTTWYALKRQSVSDWNECTKEFVIYEQIIIFVCYF